MSRLFDKTHRISYWLDIVKSTYLETVQKAFEEPEVKE